MSLSLRVFLPFGLGYFLASTFRSINAIIATDLVRDLGLSASELGFAVSAFFLSATLFQIPYGILLDRYSPPRLYASFLLLCALGAVIVSFSQDIVFLSIGRAFIALGTTASAVTSFKVFSMWYPPEKLPMVNGLALAAGGLGMMAGTAPVEFALQFMDWRGVHLILAALVVGGFAVVFFVAPSKETKSTGITLLKQISGLSVILKSLAFWRVAPLLFTVVGVYAGFPALWTGPWVRDVGGFNDFEAANLLFLMAGAMAISGAMTGIVTSMAKRLGLTTMGVAVITAILFTLIVIVLFLQWVPYHLSVILVWLLFSFLAPLNMVIYAALSTEFPLELTGRLNACLTLCWLLGGFLMQNIYGWALDQFPNKNGSYALEGHQLGLGIMVALLLAALVWFFIATWSIKNRIQVSI
jgi:MFS family permease